MEFARPTQLDDALAMLATGEWDVLAGGTDSFPALQDEHPIAPILDISAIEGLRGVSPSVDGWRIGALTTWTDLIRADLPPVFDALKLSAREVGSIQIQNRATVAGNLCNASPAADGVPPLLIMDANVELSSSAGQRVLPLTDFVLSNRQTALSEGELLTAILIPERAARGRSSFLKLGTRKYLVISIAMVSVRLVLEDDRVSDAAVAVGACSVVAQRLSDLENELIGSAIPELSNVVTARHFAGLTPISDIRASDSYREVAAIELVRRAIAQAAGR